MRSLSEAQRRRSTVALVGADLLASISNLVDFDQTVEAMRRGTLAAESARWRHRAAPSLRPARTAPCAAGDAAIRRKSPSALHRIRAVESNT
ncbi:MAG: hypothetical protein ACLTMP_02130 [Eggerthella lenta]